MEATVTSIINDTAILQIKETGQEIAWPLDDFTVGAAVGDNFTIKLKQSPAQTVNSIVAAAKNNIIADGINHIKIRGSFPEKARLDSDAMQKLLEALIN